MSSCSCKPFVRRNFDSQSKSDESSYKRSYFYENVVDHPFTHVRVKRRARDDLKVQDPVVLTTFDTTNKITYSPKYPTNCSSTDVFRKSSLTSRDTLKHLHEEYIAKPPKPLKCESTTTDPSNLPHSKIFEPQTWKNLNPTEQATCSIPSHCIEKLSSVSPTESGYTKHLDPYMTTSQLAHCNFTREHQNGVAKKNIITFYDAMDLPKCRGFGPNRLEVFGPFFHRDATISGRVRPKITPSVPFFGKISSYEAHYNFVPTNLMYLDADTHYPAVYKSSEEASYCTEQCHVGTGWPVRGSLNIGNVRGTF